MIDEAIKLLIYDRRIKRIFLSVDPNNEAAIKLYLNKGFELIYKDNNYFGVNQSRFIMEKQITQNSSISVTGEDSELLLEESGISLSYVSIVLAISSIFAALLLSQKTSLGLIIPIIYTFTAITASLYSVLFYASISGDITRLANNRKAYQGLQLGNIISEYLGVYPLVFSLPLTTLNLTQNTLLTILLSLVTLCGFALYQFSGFEIIGRYCSSKKEWYFYNIVLIFIFILHITFDILSRKIMLFTTGFIYILFLIFLTVKSLRKDREKASSFGIFR